MGQLLNTADLVEIEWTTTNEQSNRRKKTEHGPTVIAIGQQNQQQQ